MKDWKWFVSTNSIMWNFQKKLYSNTYFKPNSRRLIRETFEKSLEKTMQQKLILYDKFKWTNNIFAFIFSLYSWNY